ncbi:peptidoglycan DD-metalloendopeptidase family protein [Flavobacteriales bacterium]|nr:peptidoglycan DD-metalloendopeptidase family protein [Flavobacteriales bacterium]
MEGWIKYIFVTVALFIGFTGFGQTNEIKNLQKQKSENQRLLEQNTKQLKETTRKKQLSMTELFMRQNGIALREEQIALINREIRAVNKQIRKTDDLIESMEEDLQKLKEEYAEMVYYAYKNRNSYDRLMFVFAADDFNQAYKRLKYYQQYSEYREKQVGHIIQTQAILAKKIEELEAQKAKKESLLGVEQDEKRSLAAERDHYNKLLNDLQGDEKRLKAEIKKQQKQQKKYAAAIDKAIRDYDKEMKARGNIPRTPEVEALEKDFINNKGKLPWPVKEGVITGRYGTTSHPLYKELKITNNGIDINTSEGGGARAVFAGQVSGIIIIPGAGKTVMIRHGDYLTIYSNLSETYVQKGDKVSVKEEIGKVITDDEKTQIHFEVRKGDAVYNPSDWLYKSK